MTLIISLLAAQGDGGFGMLLMLVLMMVIMYVFMYLPQKREQKKLQKFRSSIERGSEVFTAGGIYGIVRDIDEIANVLIVEIASGVRVRVDRNSVFASPTAQQQK
ncbi:MAG: preprotein translocase subunit YajC [Actinomycetaceae bacterium]|nr:preprotein translocase subunit YajC [Actinomycetaceae bacterium]